MPDFWVIEAVDSLRTIGLSQLRFAGTSRSFALALRSVVVLSATDRFPFLVQRSLGLIT
jgi:hypothetical protein